MRRLHTTLALLLAVAVPTPSGAQVLSAGAYGPSPRILEQGARPSGWVFLEGEDGSDPWSAAFPHDDCATEDGTEALLNAPWPGVVPYDFDPAVTLANQGIAMAGMSAIQAVGNVVFVPRAGESDYLRFRNSTTGSSLSSNIGYAPGQTTISINNWSTGVIVHEVLHALGFYHEQARTDRDTFVQIFPANITPGQESQFSIRPGSIPAGPYDFGSIMQYRPCAFTVCCASPCGSCAGCETILPQPAYAAFQGLMGQRNAMTPLDVHGVRALYSFGNWRFVDPLNIFVGNGSGTNPWKELSAARTLVLGAARVFVMPGTYDAQGVWEQAMILDAPVGGVVMQ